MSHMVKEISVWTSRMDMEDVNIFEISFSIKIKSHKMKVNFKLIIFPIFMFVIQ